MVAVATMASWILPFDRKRSKSTTNPNLKHHSKAFFCNPYSIQDHDLDHDLDQNPDTNRSNTLEILAFDTAKTISTLISLYRALSDAEIARLRRVITSRGVSYLNSDDESFLLAIACAERLEDLDRAAIFVSGLSTRCMDDSLTRFDLAYRELKLGYVDLEKLHTSSGATKELERAIEKNERRIATTVSLYEELDALSQMEASERRLEEWKRSGESMAAAGDDAEAAHAASVEAFEVKIAAQRKLVRQLKEGSLWARSFDETVGFAARVICAAFARVCVHFGPYVTALPRVKSTAVAGSSRSGNNIERYSCHVALQEQMYVLDRLFDDLELLKESHSAPITGSGLAGFGFGHNNKASLVRFGSQSESVSEQVAGLDGARATGGFGGGRPKNKVFQAALPSTVGGSGLALRYANIITLAEEYIRSKAVIKEKAKNELYDMLPARLRAQVRSKLNKSWRQVEVEARRSGNGEALAVGWREASEEILNWLGPMARDTLTWLDEQSLESQRFDAPGQPTVLLMQTLHFSDLEKTETAVAQVLVGLSCIYRFENRMLANGGGDVEENS